MLENYCCVSCLVWAYCGGSCVLILLLRCFSVFFSFTSSSVVYLYWWNSEQLEFCMLYAKLFVLSVRLHTTYTIVKSIGDGQTMYEVWKDICVLNWVYLWAQMKANIRLYVMWVVPANVSAWFSFTVNIYSFVHPSVSVWTVRAWFARFVYIGFDSVVFLSSICIILSNSRRIHANATIWICIRIHNEKRREGERERVLSNKKQLLNSIKHENDSFSLVASCSKTITALGVCFKK